MTAAARSRVRAISAKRIQILTGMVLSLWGCCGVGDLGAIFASDDAPVPAGSRRYEEKTRRQLVYCNS
jgi:hypothetical protein